MKIDSFKTLHPKAPSPKDLDAQIQDASKMYEKHFLTEMVKAMRTTVTPTDQPSMGEKIYADQLDQQYVDKWSEKGGIGLSNIIYEQVKERFFPDKAAGMRPMGPLPVNKGGIQIKVDETKPMGIPILNSKGEVKPDLSYRMQIEKDGSRDVTAPWGGEIVQMFQHDDRQVLKVAHDQGLVSTINYVGTAVALNKGDVIEAGQKLGKLSPDSSELTWQIAQA